MNSIVDFLQSTMLIERLFGVGAYVLALGYFYNQIRCSKDSRKIEKYLNHYLIVLCILAFFYVPGASADLSRWRAMAEPWKNADLMWFLENRVIVSTVPAGYLLVFLCQKTGIDGILPMFCAAGFFGNVFHMMKCESKRENVNSDSVAVTLLFVMSTGVFLEVISGVRCMLALSIVIRCAYDEMRMQKGVVRHIPLYIVAVLLHTAATPLIAIRFMCMIFEKKRNTILTFLNVIFVALCALMAVALGSDYIDAAFDKAMSYTSHNVYSYVWEYLIAGIGFVLILTTIHNLKKRYPDKWRELKPSIRFLSAIIAYALIFFNVYSICQRFFSVCLICAIPVVMQFFSCEYACNRGKTRRNTIIILMVVFLIACTRGNLCGYKFFVF